MPRARARVSCHFILRGYRAATFGWPPGRRDDAGWRDDIYAGGHFDAACEDGVRLDRATQRVTVSSSALFQRRAASLPASRAPVARCRRADGRSMIACHRLSGARFTTRSARTNTLSISKRKIHISRRKPLETEYRFSAAWPALPSRRSRIIISRRHALYLITRYHYARCRSAASA